MNQPKIAKSLLSQMERAAPPERMRVIVMFRQTAKAPVDIRAFAKQVPVRQMCQLVPSVAVTATAREIASLSLDQRIESIWPDVMVHTCLDRSAARVQAPILWARGLTGAGVKIGIIDSGVDAEHPDLAGRVIATRDFTGEGEGDRNGHGTHVAGIAAGAGSTYRGVAPGASLIVAKALKTDGGGYSSEVMAALEWTVRQGARVINLSLGALGPSDGKDPLSQAVDAAVAAGAVVCIAAGNEGPAASTIGAPGAARRALTVGAATRGDSVAEFSSRGPTADGRTKPDLLAPGDGIVSCRARGTTLGAVVAERYVASSGSSMATPHVTGALALLFQAAPNLDAESARRLLLDEAEALTGEPNAVGHGMLDVRAIEKAPQTVRPATPGCLSPATLSAAFGALARARRYQGSRQ